MADPRLATVSLRPTGWSRPFARLRSRLSALAALVGVAHALPALAQTAPFTGVVALSSQLVDRGRAITPQTAVLQAAGTWVPSAGWAIGASASSRLGSPGRVVETMLQGTRYWSLDDNWQVQAGLVYYDYPTDPRYRFYNRYEGNLGISYRDILALTVSQAHLIRAEYHTNRGAVDLSARWPLPGGLSLSAGAGIAQSYVAPYKSYRYGQLGLGWTHGAWHVELDRIYARHEPLPVWRSLDPSPWLGTISLAF